MTQLSSRWNGLSEDNHLVVEIAQQQATIKQFPVEIPGKQCTTVLPDESTRKGLEERLEEADIPATIDNDNGIMDFRIFSINERKGYYDGPI